MMEVFIPKKRIPVETEEEIEEYRMLYSGKKNIYQSVYHYNGDIDIRNVVVDRIFLDFDYDDDFIFFDNVRKVAKYLADAGYTFCVRFSGRGFHIFIFLANKKLRNPKRAIRNWVKDMHKKTNTDSDPSVVGDLRRVSRMLNSMNLKTHLYCIPLQYNELMNFTYESICEMAKTIDDTSTLDYYFMGKKCLDISDFDVEEEPKALNYKIDKDNIQVQQGFPPCIIEMVKNPELGYYERGQLILYLRDDGYSFYEILTVLKNVLSEKKFYHCVQEENQVEYLYFVRENMLFSSCKTLKDNGLCPSDTCEGQRLYL